MGKLYLGNNLINTAVKVEEVEPPVYTRPSDWLTIPAFDTTKDEIYILNGVADGGMNMITFTISGTGTIDWGDGNSTTFTSVSSQNYSHHYNYADINSNTWTEHNKARQVLVHISGTRGAITYFTTAVINRYTNADGVQVNYNNATANDIYEIRADVNSCEIGCSSNSRYANKNLEVFDWNGTITNSSALAMFNNCQSLKYVPRINASNITNVASMFKYCYSLEKIPQLNMGNAPSINNMFNTCGIHKIPQLDTSNVTDMSYAFQGCYSLETIPQLNTSKVTNMQSMFNNCYALQTIPQLNTKLVTNMSGMFSGSYSLQSISQLDTRSVTSMNSMFANCSTLQSIPQLNTSNVTNMSYMFNECSSLQLLPELDASNVTNIQTMFQSCFSLQKIKLYNLNPNYSSALTLSINQCTMLTKQALVDLFNSVATNVNSYSRTIQLGSTLQGYLANVYVKDSGSAYTTILPTSDTSIQSGKTYYFKVRAYKKTSGNTVPSAWSAVKSVKIK